MLTVCICLDMMNKLHSAFLLGYTLDLHAFTRQKSDQSCQNTLNLKSGRFYQVALYNLRIFFFSFRFGIFMKL